MKAKSSKSEHNFFLMNGFLSFPTNCGNFQLVTQHTPSVHKGVPLLYSTTGDLCTVLKVSVRKVINPRLTGFACKSFYIWSGPLLHGMASCRQLQVFPHQPNLVLGFGHYTFFLILFLHHYSEIAHFFGPRPTSKLCESP